MSSSVLSKRTRSSAHEEFAKRLAEACVKHPRCPNETGRQVWLRRNLNMIPGVTISPEAVSKWFTARTRPDADMMQHVARILDVDVYWLMTGAMPGVRPSRQHEVQTKANAAVNYVAAMIEISGGTVAYAREEKETVDLYAISGGVHQKIIVVKPDDDMKNENLIHFPRLDDIHRVFVVMSNPEDSAKLDVAEIPSSVIEPQNGDRGGFVSVVLSRSKTGYTINGTPLPIIKDFAKLEA